MSKAIYDGVACAQVNLTMQSRKKAMSLISGLSPVTQYLTAEKDESTTAANYAKTDATTAREVSEFEKKAATITTSDQLMGDYSSNEVVLGAYNLSSLSNEKALEKDLLTQDPTSSTALAKTSSNATWAKFADAFQAMGSGHGTAAASPFTSTMIASTVSSFEMSRYESSDDLQNNGVGNALYFTRTMEAGGIKTISQLMSDPTLLKVAEVVSGYDPDQFGALDYDQQTRILSKKVDMTKFSSPSGIQKYAEQYLALIQVNPSYLDNDTSDNTMIDLFGGNDDNNILSLFGDSSTDSSESEMVSELF